MSEVTKVCAYCDDAIYGGTLAFRGEGVVEQTVAIDMCSNHWERFYNEGLRLAGWLPPGGIDNWRLVRLYETDGSTADAFETTHEIEVIIDDPWNGQWRLTDETEDREYVEVDEGTYRMTLLKRGLTDA